MLPELDRLGLEEVAAPACGARHVPAGQQPFELRLQLLAARDRLALARGCSGGARPGWARGPVRIRLLAREPAHGPLDAHLPAERAPVEEECGARVGDELEPLAALVAAEEREAALVGALQEHHPRRWPAFRVGSRERHGLGNLNARSARLLAPALHLVDRVQRQPCSSTSRTPATTTSQMRSISSFGRW